MPIVFRQKSVDLNGFSYCENVYRYIILFLMLTEIYRLMYNIMSFEESFF